MSITKKERITPIGMPATRLTDLPDLIEVQKKSFEWFLTEGLKEELLSSSPIKENVKKEEAEAIKKTLEELGATVEIK